MYTETLNSQIKPVPFQLYDYQKPIVKKALDTILKGENGLIVQPTGTGKTVEAAFIARACILLHKKRGLHVYDANDGLEQARKKFEEIFNGNDISCANFFGYGKEDHVRTANIVFASYQSLNHYKEKAYKTFDPTHFDFIIVNEAHHGEAVTYKEVIQHFTCPKIGMTAVPERQDGKDILNIFDKIIHEILFEEALVKGWIAQIEYHVLSSGLSTQNLKAICEDVLEKGKRITIKQLNESIFVEKLDNEILAEIHKYAFPENRAPLQTLIFCENIRHAEYMLTMLKDYNRSVDVVHSKKGKTHNRNAIRDFKAKKFQFLISVDQLNEDIDIPQVELGVFLRATNSKNIWYQQLGRLLRRTKLKQKAIVLDFVANIQRLVAVQELSKRVEEMAKLQKPLVELLPLEKDVINVSGEGFSFDFSDYTVDILKTVAAINKGRYSTYIEAKEATEKLKIKSGIEYYARYKEDPGLPSAPSLFYKDKGWLGWDDFLGTFYSTYEEVVEAVRKLQIKDQTDYRYRYKEDPKLHSAPYLFYKDKGWIGWPELCNALSERRKFYTYAEAVEVVANLKIKDRIDYNEKYKQDRKLPRNPHFIYKDNGWINWLLYLSKYYETCEEAAQAARKLRIKSSDDYRLRYKEDEKLPCNPDSFYKNEGWINWPKFLGRK